jgi:hypothetical protein
MVGRNELNEWCQSILFPERGHVGLFLGALRDGSDHVRQNFDFLGIKLEIVQGVAIVLQDLDQNRNQSKLLQKF